MRKFRPYLLVFPLTMLFQLAGAQEGKFISLSGLLQYSQVANADDYFTPTRKVIPKTTFLPGAGITFVNNFQNSFGFETGIYYSQKGQNYEGELEDSVGNIHEYSSGVRLTYLQAPLLFRFNSTMDNEMPNVYLSIKAGFQLGYLMNASIEVTPPSETNNGKNIPIKDLFKPVDLSFVAAAIFYFRVTDQWFIHSGIRMERGASDIENKSYQFDLDTPPEYRFPVSSRHVDNFPREKATNNNFALVLGVCYRIGE